MPVREFFPYSSPTDREVARVIVGSGDEIRFVDGERCILGVLLLVPHRQDLLVILSEGSVVLLEGFYRRPPGRDGLGWQPPSVSLNGRMRYTADGQPIEVANGERARALVPAWGVSLYRDPNPVTVHTVRLGLAGFGDESSEALVERLREMASIFFNPRWQQVDGTGSSDGAEQLYLDIDMPMDLPVLQGRVFDAIEWMGGRGLRVVGINGDPGMVGLPISLRTGSSMTIKADGVYHYVPGQRLASLQEGEEERDEIRYSVSDPAGRHVVGLIRIVVRGTPDGPEAVIDVCGSEAEQNVLPGLDAVAVEADPAEILVPEAFSGGHLEPACPDRSVFPGLQFNESELDGSQLRFDEVDPGAGRDRDRLEDGKWRRWWSEAAERHRRERAVR